MDEKDLDRKLLGAGMTDDRLRAIAVLHLFTPGLSERLLDQYLTSGGLEELEAMAVRTNALISSDQPLAKLIEVAERAGMIDET